MSLYEKKLHTDTEFCSADTLLTEGHKNLFLFSHRNIGPDQINLQVFFAYVENSVGAIESCLLGRGCGFVKPHPQKTTFNLERKTIWKAARRNIVIVL